MGEGETVTSRVVASPRLPLSHSPTPHLSYYGAGTT